MSSSATGFSLALVLCIAALTVYTWPEGSPTDPAPEPSPGLPSDRTSEGISSDRLYLSGLGQWKATSSAGHSIFARVPGDLITDLQVAGLISDPLRDNNFLNSSIWNDHVWTYSFDFDLPSTFKGGALVFEGVKMGARVRLNGQELGNLTSQFLRYTFDVQHVLHASNKLEVIFDPTMKIEGRFMACTGGWDWAPYTNTKLEESRTFSKGIWQPVYLEPSLDSAIEHVVPQISYKGDYPTQALVDGQHGGFQAEVRVFLRSPGAAQGALQVSGDWDRGTVHKIDVNISGAGVSMHKVVLDVPAEKIKLWWPTGLGEQPLYTISVTFESSAAPTQVVATTRKVGFRYFALVTGNDADAGWVSKASKEEGTESHGMFFRVNGAAIWSRGANMIPMEEMEGRLSDAAHRELVRSARDGGMNTLRVWGGGIFLPQAWYDACDELGILVYHDMQYAQLGHDPKKTPTQEAELRHQVRRLSAHPSIVVWDGCNECQVVMGTPTEIYATFVMTVVAEEDQSRAVWPSCPALGWTTGVHKLDSRPNGNVLTTPKDGPAIETHGYYQHGAGWPAVNGAADAGLFDAHMPIKIASAQTGPQYPNVYASEFGSVGMSSFESMAPTLSEEHWGLHAGQPDDKCDYNGNCEGPNVMAQRNYPCDNLIIVYFGEQPAGYFNTTGEAIFKKQLYQCMLAQALIMKADIETRRSKNELGHLVWQLNEIWPTGGWGSVEYGTLLPGQVLGGRWKPLHYFYQRSLFQDVMATCGDGGLCYVRNDAPRPFVGDCRVMAYSIATGEALPQLWSKSYSSTAPLAAGPGTSEFFNVNLSGLDPAATMFSAGCNKPGETTLDHANDFAMLPPFKLHLPNAAVTAEVLPEVAADGSVTIQLKTDKPALYVTLTTLAQGRFSDNAFFLRKDAAVRFLPPAILPIVDIALLRASLRVEHLQQYQQGAAEGADARLEVEQITV